MKKLLLISLVFILSLLSMLNIISIPPQRLSTVSANASESGEERQLCPICQEEEITNEVTTHCNHTFCKTCLDEYIAKYLENYSYKPYVPCPLCRASILTIDNNSRSRLKTVYTASFSEQRQNSHRRVDAFHGRFGTFV